MEYERETKIKEMLDRAEKCAREGYAILAFNYMTRAEDLCTGPNDYVQSRIDEIRQLMRSQ